MHPYSNVNVPYNVENEQPMYESVDPVLMHSKPNQEKNDKIITPPVRRLARNNKGVNDKLMQDYELYNVSYCNLCKCKLRASTTTFFTSCDGGEVG